VSDEDGYPTEEELDYFRTYKLETDLLEYLERLIDAWWMPSWGITVKKEKKFPDMKKVDMGDCIRIYISTGGWSGNESILGAIEETDFMFYYKEEWRRGGHYTLEFGLPEHEDLMILTKNSWKKK